MGNKNFFNLRQITVKTCLEYKLARADNFFAVPKLSIIVWLQRLQKALRKTVKKNLIQRPTLCKKSHFLSLVQIQTVEVLVLILPC